jgi:hypothetical protein
VSNREFLEKYASQAMVGLVGSSAPIDKAIRKAQKKITAGKKTALFSHAFIISEKRADGHWWVIESDLDIGRKQTRFGVQENRLEKYFNDELFPNLAVLDFGLDKEKTQTVLKEALDVVSNKAGYSLREIFGVLLSFDSSEKREKENVLAQENSFICSTFVQHCYSKAGLHFNPAVSLKNTTPEDIYTTSLDHVKLKLIRQE